MFPPFSSEKNLRNGGWLPFPQLVDSVPRAVLRAGPRGRQRLGGQTREYTRKRSSVSNLTAPLYVTFWMGRGRRCRERCSGRRARGTEACSGSDNPDGQSFATPLVSCAWARCSFSDHRTEFFDDSCVYFMASPWKLHRSCSAFRYAHRISM
jgi:hypothetical protein